MTLVILAAGMGSRYGGLKQIDPIGPGGEFIVDYSIFDAIRAGFDRVVFIIKKENLELFRETVGKRIEPHVPVEYVFQELQDVPEGVAVPPERVKPWGTGHALLAAANVVDDGFAVINADDFYGRDSFEKLAAFLSRETPDDGKEHYGMAGFVLENTLTENGHVSRGVCECGEEGFLRRVTERTKIQKNNGLTQYYEEESGWVTLPEGATVSMNCWAFRPSLFPHLKRLFARFFEETEDLTKGEFFLPFAVQDLMDEGLCDVKVLQTDAQWYGVTYREDRAKVADALVEMAEKGEYPKPLW